MLLWSYHDAFNNNMVDHHILLYYQPNINNYNILLILLYHIQPQYGGGYMATPGYQSHRPAVGSGNFPHGWKIPLGTEHLRKT